MFSSLLGRSNYIGFYVDCIIVVAGGAADFAAILLFGTIHAGFSLYINAMVKDMKIRLEAIKDLQSPDEPRQPLYRMKIWSSYVREIKFHIEIIK